MELSTELQLGLKRLCNPALVNNDCFLSLLKKAEVVLNSVLDSTSMKLVKDDLDIIATSKQDIIKEAYASLVSMLIIAGQHNLDASSLNHYIEPLVLIDTSRTSNIVKTYEYIRPNLVKACVITNTSLISVVDIECQLEYCIQTSVFDDVSELLYRLKLKTINNGKINHVNFVCNLQQLQEFVNKLKDAVRHLEKIVAVI
ncbi:COMM domain-containing protein 3 [Daktulosphaira vitifoliae]|uniref:COMM domain-containing protein 3 n=1 Tax=Daktulosphaira vitifoliae TaxID=58002 RepID=UPI0021AAB832|nr:COMM domain-containing protein 3 [Daktulosphaira vitifoliae]